MCETVGPKSPSRDVGLTLCSGLCLAQKYHGCTLFISVGLKDNVPLFFLSTDLGKDPPADLSLCETRHVLIREGMQNCGSPQQPLIASQVGPQTWYLCLAKWANGLWLAFTPHTFASKEAAESDRLFIHFALHSLFYCLSLFLIVRQHSLWQMTYFLLKFKLQIKYACVLGHRDQAERDPLDFIFWPISVEFPLMWGHGTDSDTWRGWLQRSEQSTHRVQSH